MQKYGKPHKLPSAVGRRTKAQVANLNAIKQKLHDYVTRKNLTIPEFCAVVDKNRNKELSLEEFS